MYPSFLLFGPVDQGQAACHSQYAKPLVRLELGADEQASQDYRNCRPRAGDHRNDRQFFRAAYTHCVELDVEAEARHQSHGQRECAGPESHFGEVACVTDQREDGYCHHTHSVEEHTDALSVDVRGFLSKDHITAP